jgi:hypothetical protein
VKKILLPIFMLLLLAGCEKKFNNPVDVTYSQYQILSVSSFQSFKYSTSNSSITIFVKVDSPQVVKQVTADIFDPSGNELKGSPIQLFDNGSSASSDTTANDGEFTNKFKMSTSDPIGKYSINFSVLGTDGQTKLVAVQYFNYNNGQINYAPVISNLVMADSITRGVDFVFTVTASDSNGLNDIKYVYFQLFKPDSSQVTDQQGDSLFEMQDDGDLVHYGDGTAGDGIYSYKNSFASTAPPGVWRFEFQAVDRSNAVSNVITHNILVK